MFTIRIARFPLLSLLLLALLLCAAVPAVAQAPSDPSPGEPDAAAPQKELTEQEKLQLKMHEEFSGFAQNWVAKLNSQPGFGMKGAQKSAQDGQVVLRYHQLEFRSSVVRESPSMPGNFSGLLRYWDVLYECTGATEAEARSGQSCHSVDGQTQAYCEIFQYKNKKWF